MLYITITLPDLANTRQSELLLVALAPKIAFDSCLSPVRILSLSGQGYPYPFNI